MKIAHISDVHIRNLKYHDEYRRSFENLYDILSSEKPDIIVNTGDTAHTKTQISPEFVQVASDHIKAISSIAPYHIILGNHDMNMMNPGRRDAVSPIVESINSRRVFLHKKSGIFNICKGYNFWVYSLADKKEYPTKEQIASFDVSVNIGLFHGSIIGCVTDSSFRMTHTEHDVSMFDGLDYVLMGDIHKRQFMDEDRKIGYAGSLIQQNFGEEINKGLLIWEINGKDKHLVREVNVVGSRKFHTLRVDDNMEFPKLDYIEKGSRIRLMPTRPVTYVEQRDVERAVKDHYSPHDIITLAPRAVKTVVANSESVNLRDVNVQESVMRSYFEGRGIDEGIIEKIIDLNKKYQVHIDQMDDPARGIFWKLNGITWSNLFNYGGENKVDFTSLQGLTGIFAPNASGKSNFIDVILETCFDATTKGVSKNIYLINDNKDSAEMSADIVVGDQSYTIDRTIERVKYGQRKFQETKEWGKTSVNFSSVDDSGDRDTMAGVTRPETERTIRKKLGTYDDFMLTSLSAQWNPLDIIMCKETRRKEILYKFLDLDVFEQKCALAKEENKEYVSRLKMLEDSDLEELSERLSCNVVDLNKSIGSVHDDIVRVEDDIKDVDQKIIDLTSKKVKVEFSCDPLSIVNRAKELEEEIVLITKKIDDAERAKSNVDADILSLYARVSAFDAVSTKTKIARLDDVEKRLSALSDEEKKMRNKIDSALEYMKRLDDVPCGGSYPACKFIVESMGSKVRYEDLSTKLSGTLIEISNLKVEAEDLRPYAIEWDSHRAMVGDLQSLENKKTNLELQIENAKLRLDSSKIAQSRALDDIERYAAAEDAIRSNNFIDLEIDVLKQAKSTFSAGLSNMRKNEIELTKKLGSDQGMLDKITEQMKQLNDVREYCTAYEYYIEAMGKDGIAYHILTEKLPVINEEVNKILANAADFRVFIEHDNEEQSIRLFMQYGQYKPRLLELGSGAEKMLASIALRTALLNVSNLPKTNMFVIDEGFGKLDPKNLESIAIMFDYLRQVFDHVLVVSHLDALKDLVDNIIEITTDDEGYAHIEVG